MKNLFLDDFRTPADADKYMNRPDIYQDGQWRIVKNYPMFVKWIKENGLPNFISFDHDLVAGHYHKNMQSGVINYDSEDFKHDFNKTGWHCAKWLIEYCIEKKLRLPDFIVHSMNPLGKSNIEELLNSFKKEHQND